MRSNPGSFLLVTFPVLLAIGACGDTATGSDAATLELVSGHTTADSAQSIPEPIVVRVRDGGGNPVIGANVEFVVLPRTDGNYGAYFTISTDNIYRSLRPTEEGGLVNGRIGFTGSAGPVDVRIRIENSDREEIVHLTVLPGNAVRAGAVPVDTAVYAGGAINLRAGLFDQFGNKRPEAITYQGLTPDITITAGGALTAGAISRNSYLVSGGGFSDTGWVSIVPPGTLAAFQNRDSLGLVLFNLDGSGFQWLKSLSGFGSVVADPVWNGTGSALFATLESFGDVRLHRLDVPGDGVFQRVIPSPPGVLELEMWPTTTPDGQYIFFSGWTIGRNASLWRVKANGDSAIQVGQQTGLFATAHIEWRSTPSHDGTKVAFVTREAGTVIKTMDVATQTYSTWSVGPGQTPFWSPVNDEIAYVVEGGGAIRLVNGDGSNDRQISSPGRVYRESRMTWSPDGAWIVAQGTQYLELIHAQSGLTLPLAYTAPNTSPSWRP